MKKQTKWDKYLGIPYEHGETSFDSVYCWGLIRLVYREEISIDLGDYWYQEDWYKPGNCENEKFLDNTENEGFFKVDNEFRPYDVILMRFKSRKVNHCGLITDNQRILHAHDGANSCRVPFGRLDTFKHSIWRHKSRE